MRSIYLKLILAFIGISVFSILLLAVSSGWATNRAFVNFISDQNQSSLTSMLAEYYEQTGGWENLEIYEFRNSGDRNLPGMPFTLVDSSGLVIRGNHPYVPGQTVPETMLETGIPIQVGEQTVGYLIMSPNPIRENSPEREFVDRTSRVIAFSGLGAAIIALILGIILSRSISRPIRELTAATQAISQGELGQQVNVRNRDELGQLASAFNQMSTDLEHSIRSRKQMTADIAHELRTPLSVILGHADAVHDGVLPPSRENFEIIREEAGRLEHLIEDLRILSLVDAGELTLNRQPVELGSLLSEIITAFTPRARLKHITLKMDIEPDLHPILLDASRINQIMGNILDNALRYTPENGQITLSARHTGDQIELALADTGPGVPDEDLPHIFDRLFRSDESRQRDSGGSGLGLSIARSLVQAHGGEIRAVNDQGLRIIIRLPAQES